MKFNNFVKMNEGSINLNEKVTNAVIRRIAKLTDRNDHNGAMLVALTALGMTWQHKAMEHVTAIHKIMGHMPPELTKYRKSLYDEMMHFAKRGMSKEEYKEFYNAF